MESDQFTKTNPGQAALAALAAYETAPTQEARSALMRRYENLRDTAWLLSGVEGKIAATAMSTDGAVTLVTTDRGRATLFLRSAEGRVRQQQLRLADNVLSPVVSRDGRRIAYLREDDGAVFWHDVTSSGERPVGPAHPLQGSLRDRPSGTGGGMKVSAFSPDARRLVGVSATSRVLMWDLETGLPRTLPNEVDVGEVWFGPDGNTLVTPGSPRSATTSMVAVDIAAGTTRELAGDIDFVGVGVSGDGGVTVVCQKTKTDDPKTSGKANYQAVRVADGRVLRRHAVDASCTRAVIDAKGERFAVHAEDDEWDLVDTRDDSPAQRFLGPSLFSGVDMYAGLPLLGTAREPVMATTQHENAVIGWPMRMTGGTAFSPRSCSATEARWWCAWAKRGTV